MALSKELQIGKAGEHLVCFDLIQQGYNAFLTGQGLPFDVIVEKDGVIKKIQVKTTWKLKTCGKSKNIYRFSMRRGRGSFARLDVKEADYFAFVALDTKHIAYFPIKKLIAKSGKIKQTMDFKSRNFKYKGRIYSTGKVRTPEWGKYLEDYWKFDL